MSDLISTPSQSQSQVSNEAFEALIDLLAFDGIDDAPSKPAGQPNATLRDPSGKLDFDKIRTMFEAQNESQRAPNGRGRRVPSPIMVPPHVDDDSDDEARSHRSASSTAPSRAQSMSPKPVERPCAGHRRSSTFGNQPGLAIHEKAVKVDDLAPTLSRQPMSSDELNAALAGAHEEVRALRRQYDELRALVGGRLGTELRARGKSCPGTFNIVSDKDRPEPGARIVPFPPPPSDVPTDIDNLSEAEAKRALSALARSLNLSPSALAGLSSFSPLQSSLPPTREHDVASIRRALKFLGTVDELVWRRTSSSSGPRTLLPMFSEENVVALVARLELWERAVRRSSRA